MILTEILSSDRVRVATRGSDLKSKDDALHALAELLGSGLIGADRGATFIAFSANAKALQSTGIGDGVAIPHGALENLGGAIGRAAHLSRTGSPSMPSMGAPSTSSSRWWAPSERPAST